MTSDADMALLVGSWRMQAGVSGSSATATAGGTELADAATTRDPATNTNVGQAVYDYGSVVSGVSFTATTVTVAVTAGSASTLSTSAALVTIRRKPGTSAPTEIDAWLWLDVERTPVALSFALVRDDGTADLFVDGEKIGGPTKIGPRAQVVIGTHALMQEGVAFCDLALVIIDEQHRFGVEQRDVLRAKSSGGRVPHHLVMTATPIPRTVAMTVFGDLETSVLTELPKGRQEISTSVVPMGKPAWMNRVWERAAEEVGT